MTRKKSHEDRREKIEVREERYVKRNGMDELFERAEWVRLKFIVWDEFPL